MCLDGRTYRRTYIQIDGCTDSLEGGGCDNLDPRQPPMVYDIIILCFLLFLKKAWQTDGQMEGHKDWQTDKGSNTRLGVFISLPRGFWNQFYYLSNTAVFTIFPFKIRSDPCPLKILILHGKCENEKSKNMGTWQIRLPRCPCFSKCKNICFFPDLKFSMGAMFFSKISKFNKTNIKNFIFAKLIAKKITALVLIAGFNTKFWNMTFSPHLKALTGD